MSVLINVLVHTPESYRDVVRTRDLATLRSLLRIAARPMEVQQSLRCSGLSNSDSTTW